MGIHWQELIVILLIVLVLFGPKRLPEIGSSLGKGIKGFRDSMNGTRVETPTPSTTLQASAEPAAIPVPVEVVETTSDDVVR